MELTVGYVAGMVAAGFFIAHLLSPNALALIVSWRLQEESTASTMTVAASSFQKSHWPLLLWTDGNHNNGVSKSILWSSRLIPTLGLLLAIGSVITPLGLYSTLSPGHEVEADFVYIADPSPFGYGTPPRSSLPLARQCLGGRLFSGPVPCPFSDSISIVTHFPNDTVEYDYPYDLNTQVPDTILEIYSSGTDKSTTVSNYFDIQWRRYTTSRNRLYDNGSRFLVADNRNMESLILTDTLRPVEGLVVDTVQGGVGFRNHTLPIGFAHGARWEEDLLFVEPETVCVDTNLTVDFTIVRNSNLSSSVTDFRLTDRGGFVNLNYTYPRLDLHDSQENPNLYARAYKAAWLHNAYTALYFNVTTISNEAKGIKAWSYVDSEIGKSFRLSTNKIYGLSGISSLTLTLDFGGYIQGVPDNVTNFNPFRISSSNYSAINILCGGAGNGDYANITNILVACGQMRSVPQRVDEGSNLIMEDGSSWSQKIYTCATAAKATIKTVSFSYNTTSTAAAGAPETLTSLTIEVIRDKKYSTDDMIPLWGVEDTGNAYNTSQMNLVWGLVSSTYEGHPNVSTVRQPSLYLPGWIGDSTSGAYTYGNWENMPGSDFSVGALATAYAVLPADASITSGSTVDYTGDSSLAMWAKWQNLTKSADTASLIPNLIFTDSVASTVVGTKGALGSGNSNSAPETPVIRVTPVYPKIGYNLPYAIPAFIAAVLLLGVLSVAIVAALGKGAGHKRMRRQIQQFSPGRIYTTFLHPESGALMMPSSEWSKRLGDKLIDLSGEYPVPGRLRAPGGAPDDDAHEFKDTTTVSTTPVVTSHQDLNSLEEQQYNPISPAAAQEQYYYGNHQVVYNGYQAPEDYAGMNHQVYSGDQQPYYYDTSQTYRGQ